MSEPVGHTSKLFRGTIWMIAMRWSVRLLGIVSITILARLLDKEDFGLVAIASAIIAFPMALINFGVEGAIIRDPNANADTYNTAWTIRAIQMCAVGAVMYLVAPFAVSMFHDERLIEIVQVLAVMVALQGLENTWVVSFRKELRFDKDFAYNASTKFVSTAATIALAFYFRSYWVLVWGQLIYVSCRIVIGSIMTARLPRPTLAQWQSLWGYSKWSLVLGLASYIGSKADRLILGRVSGLSEIGAYTLGKEIAEMPVAEVSMPINRALSPGLANLQTDPVRFATAVAKSVGAVATLTLPLGVGLSLVAADVVPLILGPGWSETIPLLEIIAVAMAITAPRSVVGNSLAVMGQIRASAIVGWILALTLILTGVPAAALFGTVGMASAYFASETMAILAMAVLTKKYMPEYTGALFLKCIWRPVTATIVMSAALLLSYPFLSSLPFRLALEIIVGGVVYCGTALLLWFLSGKPDGLERLVIDQSNKAFKRINS